MTGRYPVGKRQTPYTEKELRAYKSFRLLDPEVQRRAIALMDIAQTEGHGGLTFSGGWRDGRYAEAEFYRRYTPTTQTGRVEKTDKLYDRVWWSLNPGEIGCATPYNGFHTYGRPDTPVEYTPLPAAIDWYQDLRWMQANCHRVGFKHYAHIPGEGHHTQPVEYPGSRSEWRALKHPLTVWPIVGWTPAPPPPPMTVDEAKQIVLRQGSHGEPVVILQQGLNARRPLKIDGDFGRQTKKAVIMFQTDEHIRVDGVVGPQTWGRLYP